MVPLWQSGANQRQNNKGHPMLDIIYCGLGLALLGLMAGYATLLKRA